MIKLTKKARLSSALFTFLAGPQGLEPRQTDPKSAVLPLDEGPMGKREFIESS
jgi:hypothetical protein